MKYTVAMQVGAIKMKMLSTQDVVNSLWHYRVTNNFDLFCSVEREQPLSHFTERCSVHSKRL